MIHRKDALLYTGQSVVVTVTVSSFIYSLEQLLISRIMLAHYMFIQYYIMIILMIYLIDDTQGGNTALHYAVSSGYCDCAQLLIQAGADVDIQTIVITLYVHTVYHHDHTHNISY